MVVHRKVSHVEFLEIPLFIYHLHQLLITLQMATSDISDGVDGTTILDDDDLNEVIEFVQDIKANYFTLGTALRLKLATVEGIKKEKLDTEESLLKVINEWLLKNYNYKKFGKPTWKALVKAVASPMGGKNVNLALKIAEKHPAAGGAGSNGISMHEPTMQAEIPNTDTTSAAATPNGQTLSPTTGSAGSRPQQPAGVTTTRTVVESRHYGGLCEQLNSCAAKWEAIALGLRFTRDELNTIRVTPMNVASGPQACLGAMLGDWIHWAAGDGRGSKDRATLEALRKALYSANCGDVAETLTLSE